MTDLNDNVDKLKRFLQDQGYELAELENGLQVRCGSGHFVEINALTRDSDYFWASFETKSMAPEKRRVEIASVHGPLSASLHGLATVGAFEKTQDADDRFVYVANVEIDPSIRYHGAIDMDDVSATEWPAAESRGDRNHRQQDADVTVRQTLREDVRQKKPQPATQRKPALKPRADEIYKEPGPSVERAPVVPETPDPLADARAAVAQLENIDGKMIRQRLDMMNLRRSSNIRLMLTRIFRSAVEPEELMRAIGQEAEKIVTADDRQELEIVRILSENSFLEPVVSLLCRETEKKASA